LSSIVEYLHGDLAEARALWAEQAAGVAPSGHPQREPEVTALNAAVRALSGLERPACRRVLAYLEDRFGGEGCES